MTGHFTSYETRTDHELATQMSDGVDNPVRTPSTDHSALQAEFPAHDDTG